MGPIVAPSFFVHYQHRKQLTPAAIIFILIKNKTVVALRKFLIFPKILALVVIAALLSLPLASLIQAPNPVSVDPHREVAFTASNDEADEDYLTKTEPEIFFHTDLAPSAELGIRNDRLHSSIKPAATALLLKDVLAAIFVPPRFIS